MPHTSPEAFQACLQTPVGPLGIRTTADALIGIQFLSPSMPTRAPKPNSIAQLVCSQLEQYFARSDFVFDLPLVLNGSQHEGEVWAAMRAIPAGETRTYGAVAHAIGSSARAVGTACGLNPVPIVIPCHRIVAANGLGGFMGGKRVDSLAIKRWLLAHESASAEAFTLRA